MGSSISKDKLWKKIKSIALNHRKTTTVLLVLTGCICSILPCILFKNENVTEQLYYTSQIVSSVFIISGVIIAAWQYYVTSCAELSKIEIEQVQKAIDLSSFYKDKILKPYQAIYYVYLNSGVLDILNLIKQEDMIAFDTVELDILLGEKKINALKTMQEKPAFHKSVLEANSIYNLNLCILQRNAMTDAKTENTDIEINLNALLISFMSGIVTNMLNDLEFFAMHFTHNSADESVVFQSLHQTYIHIVKTLYYNMSKCNKPSEGKYYTNIIELYEIWYKRSEEQKNKSRNSLRHKTSKGTIIESRD